MRTEITAILTTIILVTGCVEKNAFKDIHVYPNTSIPIGRLSVSDSAIFAMANVHNNISVGDSGVINFVSSENVTLSKPGTDAPLFSLEAQHLTIDTPLPSTPGGIDFIDITTPIELDFPLSGFGTDIRIDKMAFVNGSISLLIDGLTVPGYNPDLMNITIPGIKVDGSPLVLHPGQTLTLTPKTTIQVQSGNTLKIHISGRVPAMAALTGSLTLDPRDEVYSAEGFFGHKEISNINLIISAPKDFDNFAAKIKYVRFDNPIVELRVVNQYNTPIMARIDRLVFDGQVEVYLKKEANTHLMYVPPRGEAKMIINNQSTVRGDELSNAITKDFKQVEAIISSIANPTAQDIGDPNYIAPTTNSMNIADQLTGVMTNRVPLDCVIDELEFEKVGTVDLQQLIKEDMTYQHLDFTLSGYNQLPLDMAITAYVKSHSGEMIKLFEDPIILPPSINNMLPTRAGFLPAVIGKENLISRTIPKSVIDDLLHSSQIKLHFTASTKNAASRSAVKIFSPSELNLQLTLGARADITVSGSK